MDAGSRHEILELEIKDFIFHSTARIMNVIVALVSFAPPNPTVAM